jgi:hypothetical protein
MTANKLYAYTALDSTERVYPVLEEASAPSFGRDGAKPPLPTRMCTTSDAKKSSKATAAATQAKSDAGCRACMSSSSSLYYVLGPHRVCTLP